MNTKLNINQVWRSVTMISLMVVAAVILAACAPAAPVSSSNTPTSTALSIDLSTDPNLGQYLVDNNGLTLYLLTKDTANTSTCNAACQGNWPPLVSASVPKAGPGVQASLVGLATLSNGTKIVTYDQHPLYYKKTDTKAGQKTGEDYNNVWFIVSPAGLAIQATAGSTPTASASTGAATPAATPITVTEPSINVVNDPKLGNILVGTNGWTVYMYALDGPDKSNCLKACAAIWLPVYTLGHPQLGTGVTSSLIGNAKLANGNMILTYNHMPLYYFVGDTAAGQTTGQGFDNVWFAVSPDGKKVGSLSEVTINVATDPTLGSYLVDGMGNTLYIYTKDSADMSTCSGVCAAFWPPLYTLGKPTLGSGVDHSLVGTITLPDGSKMVTYNHMPLYYYAGDGKPSQILGQGVLKTWYVIGPDGKPIMTALPASTGMALPEQHIFVSTTTDQLYQMLQPYGVK